MPKDKQEKTNVMRLIEAVGVPYAVYDYLSSGMVDSLDVAKVIGQDPDRMFKTLVTVSASGENYVFMIPASQALDLKKAAAAVGEKKIDMLRSKELLPLTGYVHGGCSPIGMKRFYQTTIDDSAQLWERIIFSGGKIGDMVEVATADLPRLFPFSVADLLAGADK